VSRVVVTGGLGFVGSRLCDVLAQAGHELTVVDDLSAGHATPGERPGRRLAIVAAEHAETRGLLDGADAIVHLAAIPGVRSRVGPRRLAEQNVAAVESLGRAAAARGMRFVLASTSSVYGDADELPTPESAPPRPLNPYARSKAAAENVCRTLASAGADAVVARLFTVFGPGQRPDMAFARWIACLSEGCPLPWCAPPGAARELTYVDDAARGLLAVLEHGRAGQAYNVGGCGPIGVREALAELETLLGADARLDRMPAGVREATVTAACGRKALRELGYAPATDFREGLRLQVAAAAALTRPAVAA
jgi:nucleoside-diphosphate-sugar epimerase